MRFAIPLVVLLGLLSLFYFGLYRDPRLVPSPLIGKAAPAFDLPTLDGQPPRLTTADLKGAPVLVNFFASWCGECQVEHPYLMQLGHSGQVRLVGIDYKDAESDLLPWLSHKGNPYGTILSDLEGRAGIDWGVYGVPETFVLDAQGNILFKQVGAITPEVWAQQIQPLLKKSLMMLRLVLGITLALASIVALAQVETPKPPIALTDTQEALYKSLLPELRCLVCQNESLAESQAALAADLRYEVRGLVAKGQDRAQVKKYLTDRYGDFILYKPPLEPRTVVLWFGPFILLIGALGAVVFYARRARPSGIAPAPVDAVALKKILDETP